MKQRQNILKIMNNRGKLGAQCGRSMVEVLGVLAIVGVLSIGGIVGFTTAMRKYRANEIVNEAGVLVVSSLISSSTPKCVNKSIAGLSVIMLADDLGEGPEVSVQITRGADAEEIDELDDIVRATLGSQAGYQVHVSSEAPTCDD